MFFPPHNLPHSQVRLQPHVLPHTSFLIPPHVSPHVFTSHLAPSYAPCFLLPHLLAHIYNTPTITPCLRHAHHPNFYPNPIFQLHNIVHIFTFVKQTKTKAEISLRQIKLSSFLFFVFFI